MKNLKKVIFLSIILFFISSCSEMNSSFDCPMKPGINCQSIEKINSKVDEGEYSSTDIQDQNELERYVYKHASQKKEYIPVWVAPYEDDHGNYHKASYLYANISKQTEN